MSVKSLAAQAKEKLDDLNIELESAQIKPEPKAQTKATTKYQKAAGLVSKSYKLKAEVVERFAEACEKAGISQAAALTQLMNDYISLEEAPSTRPCFWCRLKEKLKRRG